MGGSVHIMTQLRRELWPALVDPTQLELAVLNLAINARDAMPVGGTLRVETENATLGPGMYAEEPPAGDYVGVCVSDTGTGMSDDIRAMVFEPFFTTKAPNKGSGLGLSQVLGFAKQSGGGVRIESRVGQGTAVHIYLPRAQGQRAEAGPVVTRREAVRAVPGSTILLVDDDNAVREVTRAMLHELGYRVLESGSGGAALDLLAREPNVALMMVDFAMPGMNGAELARQVQAKWATLPILFVTGFADRTALGHVDEAHIIRKPLAEDELAAKVRLALADPTASKVVRLRG